MSRHAAVSHAGLGLSDEGERYFRDATWADAFRMYFPSWCCYDPDRPGTVLVSSVFAMHERCMEMHDHLRWRKREVADLGDEVLALKARVYQLEDELGHSPSVFRADVSGVVLGQSVSQGFICETTNKRANTCDPTIEECSSRSSMTWCLGLVWSACACRVPCLPKLVLF